MRILRTTGRGPALVNNAWLALSSLALEAAVGYPSTVHAWIPHPVVWVGNGIELSERLWNRTSYSFGARRLLGCVAIVMLVSVAVAVGLILQQVLETSRWGLAGIVVIGTVGLAQRSLFVHVSDVLRALRAQDLDVARVRVARIVGRDTSKLEEAGICGAALESLAESFNDGIVAPAFWFVVAGLPGLFAYKVLNTADSVIGHMEDRWRAFGWAAARADDLANLIPARVAGLLLVLAGRGGWMVMLRDAAKHASPNAGWPEAAMAGALDIRLGGPATYDGVLHERPVFGVGLEPSSDELARGLRIYVVACGLLWAVVAAVGLAGWAQSITGWRSEIA